MEPLFKLGVLSCISFYISEFTLVLKVGTILIVFYRHSYFNWEMAIMVLKACFLCAQMGNVKITCLFLFFYSLIINNLTYRPYFFKMYCYQIWYHLKNFKTFSFYEQLVNV